MHWLPQILRLLPSGGVLLSDNVLQDGDIVGIPLCGRAPQPDDPHADARLFI